MSKTTFSHFVSLHVQANSDTSILSFDSGVTYECILRRHAWTFDGAISLWWSEPGSAFSSVNWIPGRKIRSKAQVTEQTGNLGSTSEGEEVEVAEPPIAATPIHNKIDASVWARIPRNRMQEDCSGIMAAPTSRATAKEELVELVDVVYESASCQRLPVFSILRVARIMVESHNEVVVKSGDSDDMGEHWS